MQALFSAQAVLHGSVHTTRFLLLMVATAFIAALLQHCLQLTTAGLGTNMTAPPLRAVSTVPDCVKFMQTFQVTSPAKDFFTSLRRYPNMRSEVEVSMRGLRAALGSAYRAAHGISERLVKLKVSLCYMTD